MPFLEFVLNGIIEYVILYIFFFSFSTILLRFIYNVVISSSFLFFFWITLPGWIYHSLSIHQSIYIYIFLVWDYYEDICSEHPIKILYGHLYSFLFDTYPGVVFLGNKSICALRRKSLRSPKVLASFCILTCNIRQSTSTCHCHFKILSILVGTHWCLIGVFICIFLCLTMLGLFVTCIFYVSLTSSSCEDVYPRFFAIFNPVVHFLHIAM